MKIYRDEHVHVMREKCATCIFRPGNLMHLRKGRVRSMVGEAMSTQGCIVCHDTMNTPEPAVCRGFFDRYPTTPLQLAERLDRIRWQDTP